ncbi:MAG: sensor histidine kinase, partial [Dehalococcoidia bacterium]
MQAGYRVLFDDATDAIVVFDAEGRLLEANEAAARLSGRPRGELIRLRIADLVAGDQRWVEAAPGHLHAEGAWWETLDVRRKDGTVVSVEAHIGRLQVSTGVVFLAVMRDLSERQRLEALQRAREQQLRLITDAMPVLISYIDTDRRYRFVNTAHEEWFGFSRREIVGRRVEEVLGEAGYAAITAFIERALAGENVTYETEVPYPGGRTRVTSGTLVPHIVDGEVLGCFGLISDLTERKRAEDALHFLAEASVMLATSLDHEMTLRRVADLAVPRLADTCVVDVLDDAGRLHRLAVASVDGPKVAWVWDIGETPLDTGASHGPGQVLRSGAPELVSQVTEAYLAGSARSAEHLAHLRQAGIVSSMIVPLRARDRTFGTLTFVTTRSGRRYGPEDLALAEDLARRAALAVDNARLYQAAQAALRVRDEFLSSVTHDLRTPLSTIKGRTQLLQRLTGRGESSPDALTESLSVIEAVVDRVNGLVDDLVDLSRLESGRTLELIREAIDLIALARSCVADQQRETERHQIRVVTGEETLIGSWDSARLERVLINLLSNAVRYSL